MLFLCQQVNKNKFERGEGLNERQKRLKQMEQKGYLAMSPKQREENLKQALESLKALFIKDYKDY